MDKVSRLFFITLMLAAMAMTPSGAAENQNGKVTTKSNACSARLVLLNNEGVKALNARKYEQAVKKLSEALRMQPDYDLAAENLAIAYNNWGLSKIEKPKEAIKLFHMSAFIDPKSNTVFENLERTIEILHMAPDSFNDRVKLAEEARTNGDFAGAIVEFEAALKIKSDIAVAEKLKAVVVPEEWQKIRNSRLTLSKNDQKAATEPKKVAGPPDVDYGPYMAEIQHKIKRHWFPPRSDRSKRAKVTFNVNSKGLVSNAKLAQSTGSADGDRAALDAIKNSSPLPALPDGSPETVTIEFTFDYNVFSGGKDKQLADKSEGGSASSLDAAKPPANKANSSPLSVSESGKSKAGAKETQKLIDQWAPWSLGGAVLLLLLFLYMDRRSQKSQLQK